MPSFLNHLKNVEKVHSTNLYKYIWTIRQTIRLQYTQWQALLAGYNTQTHLHGVDDGL